MCVWACVSVCVRMCVCLRGDAAYLLFCKHREEVMVLVCEPTTQKELWFVAFDVHKRSSDVR